MDAATNTLRALNAQNSPLLALPGELRNRIYRYVLLDTEVLLNLHAIHSMTKILRASSQLREEAKVILYGENHFLITDAIRQQRHVEGFLAWVSKKNACRIQLIVLRLDIPPACITTEKIAKAGIEKGLSEREVVEEIGKKMGSSERKTGLDVIWGIIGDVRGALTTIATDLVENGVQSKGIIVQDLGRPATDLDVSDDGWVENSGKVFVQKVSNFFNESLQVAMGKVQNEGGADNGGE